MPPLRNIILHCSVTLCVLFGSCQEEVTSNKISHHTYGIESGRSSFDIRFNNDRLTLALLSEGNYRLSSYSFVDDTFTIEFIDHVGNSPRITLNAAEGSQWIIYNDGTTKDVSGSLTASTKRNNQGRPTVQFDLIRFPELKPFEEVYLNN